MNLYAIPPSTAFLPSLAQGLQQRYGMSKIKPLILLPTKEACDRFKSCELYPCQVVALGDLNYFLTLCGRGLPRPIPNLQRQILIQQWLMDKAEFANPSLGFVHSLLDLLDEFYLNEQPLERLLTIKIGEWADYWRLSLGRLQQLVCDWPRILATKNYGEDGLIQRMVFDRLCQAWQKNPPNFPIIIAGTRGSRPATRRLMATVMRLPQGAVILPPFDFTMFQDQPLPMTHPVYAIQNLVQALGNPKVQSWYSENVKSDPSSIQIMREAMRPPSTTDQWHKAQPESHMPPWHLMTFPTRQQEASKIIELVKTYKDKGRIGIVSVDSHLTEAIRVLGQLNNLSFSILPTHLGQSPLATLLKRLYYCWTQDFTPSSFLNLMQHPWVVVGDDQDQWRNWLSYINKYVLRGPKPISGWPGLRKLLQNYDDEFNRHLLAQFDSVWANKPKSMTGEAWFDYIEQTLRTLCSSPGWSEAGGDVLIEVMGNLKPMMGSRTADQAQQLLKEALCYTKWVETQAMASRNIDLLMPTQARLLDYDIWILAGCQEGSWPRLNSGSLWLNQAMRTYCGLPSKEWAIGHAAHDFCWPLWQGKKIFITTHTQEDNTYVQPSRWVQRLEFVLQHYGWLETIKQDFSKSLPIQQIHKATPPAPTPLVEARPTIFSISDVSCWRRNPYHFYAEKILKLKPLEALEANPDRADYGRRLHQVLEEFVRAYPDQLPEKAESILVNLGQKFLQDFADKPSLWQLWWPRFCQIAKWFVQHEAIHRQTTQRLGVELSAKLDIEVNSLHYTLKGVIDRLDQGVEGGIHIIDYKTGGVPVIRDVVLGMAPQLPLEACLILDDNLQNHPIYLDYWQLQGAYEGGQVKQISDDGQILAQQALAGLKEMIAVFAQPQTPYLAHPFSDWPPFVSPYDHLARVDSWRWDIQDGDEV